MVALEQKLKELDNSEQVDEVRHKVFLQLQEAYQMEISQLKQKARLKWDLEGDKNSRFFHLAVQKRRRINQINSFVWKDKMMFEPMEIKNTLFHSFKEFFTSNQGQTPFSLSSLDWYKWSTKEASILERPFDKDEIWAALRDSDSSKAPGPDDLNAGWIKMIWPLVSDKILEFLQDFHKFSAIKT